jgi:hypothetical protein
MEGARSARQFMRKLASPAISIPLSGFLYCILLVGSLNLAPMLTEKDGYVWSPLNSAQYKSNDEYYYAAWMMEAAKGTFPPGNPSARENADVYSVEIFKVVPIILSAFPALFLSDPRYIYFVSFTVFPGILFLLSYSIAFRFTRSGWNSFSIGMAAVFYYWAWHCMQGGFLQSISNFLHYPLHIITISNTDLSDLNSSFRFINISISGVILLALILSLVRLQEQQTWDRFTIALIFCLAISFTYLPMMVLSYALLAVFSSIYFIRANRKLFYHFFSLGAAVLIFLLSVGYLDMIGRFSENTHFLHEIFISERNDGGGSIFRPLVMNAYFWVGLIALACSWRIYTLRDWILALVIVSVLFELIFLAYPNDQYKTRFYSRAFLQPFVVFSLTAAVAGIKDLCKKDYLIRLCSANHAQKYLCFIVISSLVLFPAIGFSRYAAKNAQSLASYIPQGQWEAFQWLKKNTERDSVVLAIDWNDVYLVPIYTDNNLFFGHYIIENRTMNNEVDRYLSAWHLLGLPREDLLEFVSESVQSYLLLINTLFRSNSFFKANQFPSRETHESASFIHGLIYYPYNKKINRIKLESPDFLPHVMKYYDELDWIKVLDSTPCDYVLVSDFYLERARALTESGRFKLVYSNDIRRIYRLVPFRNKS